MSRRVTQQPVPPASGPRGLLSVEDVAAGIGRHPEVVRRQARAGRLPAEKIGRVWFFRPEALAKAGYAQFRSSAPSNPGPADPLLLALSKAGLAALQLRVWRARAGMR